MWLRILIYILQEMFLLLCLKKGSNIFFKSLWRFDLTPEGETHLWLHHSDSVIASEMRSTNQTSTAGVSEGFVWDQEGVAACLQLHPCFMSPFIPTDSWTHTWAVAAGVSMFSVLVEVVSLFRADWGVVNLWAVASEGVSTQTSCFLQLSS